MKKLSMNLGGLILISILLSACDGGGSSSGGSSGSSGLAPPISGPSGSFGLAPPIISSVGNVTSSSLTISWGAVEGASYYDVFNATALIATNVTSLSYTHTGLDPARSYSYGIKACNVAGCSELSAPASGITIPSIPMISSIGEAAHSSLTIYWDAVVNASYYQVFIADTPTAIATNITSLSYTHTGLDSARSYSYSIRACNTSGCSANSAIVSGITNLAIPTTPVISSVGDATPSNLTISWGSAEGAIYYQVFRAGTPTAIAVNVASLSYTHTGLDSARSYSYRVRACNTVSCSKLSAPASGITIPSIPIISSVGDATPSNLTISWSSVEGANYYDVFDATSSTPIAANVTSLSYTHTGLDSARIYSYIVRACNAAGCSARSEVSEGTTLIALPTIPYISNISSVGIYSFNITWDSVAGASHYNLYRNGTQVGDDIASTGYLDGGLSLATEYSYALAACNSSGCSTRSALVSVTTYSWSSIASSPRWSARSSHSSVVLGGVIYVMGGHNGSSLNDVWSSSDGVNWTEVRANNPSVGWSGRDGHSSVVLDDTIYVMGGVSTGGYFNDVWSSSNGINWTQVSSSASWNGRYGHSSVVLNGTIYVIGGEDGTNYFNEVWSSSDGANWTQVSSSNPLPIRFGHSSVVLDDTIYVMGGFDGSRNVNDVWSSSDGANWTQVNSSAPWSARWAHSSVVLDGVIYVMGGDAGRNYRNDVWSSSDGANWTNVTSSAPWPVRDSHSSVVLDGAIYVMGGWNGGRFNDVWSFAADLLD